MPPSAGSPLEAVASSPSWKAKASQFSEAWRRLEESQLSKARPWADTALAVPRKESEVLYYPFSGPDFLYAGTLFPGCKTYVLCGLEPVGTVPDLLAIPQDRLGGALGRLYSSLNSVLSLSFFITKDMQSDLRAPQLPGTTPILLAFMARLGKNIKGAQAISIDREGNEVPPDPAAKNGNIPGVKIEFHSPPDARPQTLYYFSTDISNGGLAKNPGFARFCQKLSPGAGLVKAASYLMHNASFSTARDLLLERCKHLLQDDSGIPILHFARHAWKLQPFGHYAGPIQLFRGYSQRDLFNLFAANEDRPLPFGYGYHHSNRDSNLVLATRVENAAPVAMIEPAPAPAPAPTPAPAPAVSEETSASPKSLAQLEQEELRVRNDAGLSQKEKMAQLRKLWAQQLPLMGAATKR